MELDPVIVKLITQRTKESPDLKVGEIFAARIMEIRDRTLLLMLKSGRVLQTKLLADLEICKDQIIKLQVKGIGEERIELEIVSSKGYHLSTTESIKGEYSTCTAIEDTGIIYKMMENGLPVTPGSIEAVKRAVKHISYLLDNALLSTEYLPPADIDLLNAPLGELVRWLLGPKEEVPIGQQAADSIQKLSLLLAELPGVEAEDVIKLIKCGLRLNLTNVVLAKNLRENKGFPDILLKLIFKQARLKEEQAETESKRPTVEPVDIKVLLESIEKAGKATPRQRAAAELLAQRTELLDKVTDGQNLCVFPFLFKGELCGCIIRNSKGRSGGNDRQDEVLELEIETKAPNMGSIKTHIKLAQKDMECDFFVERDYTKRLIDREKHILRRGLEKLGFSVNRIDCCKKAEIKSQISDEFIDLKV